MVACSAEAGQALGPAQALEQVLPEDVDAAKHEAVRVERDRVGKVLEDVFGQGGAVGVLGPVLQQERVARHEGPDFGEGAARRHDDVGGLKDGVWKEGVAGRDGGEVGDDGGEVAVARRQRERVLDAVKEREVDGGCAAERGLELVPHGLEKARVAAVDADVADAEVPHHDDGVAREERAVSALPARARLAALKVSSAEGGVEAVAALAAVAAAKAGDDEDDVSEYFFGSIEERSGDLPVLSPTSPMGKAVHGKAKGHEVSYVAPGGELTIVIVDVRA